MMVAGAGWRGRGWQEWSLASFRELEGVLELQDLALLLVNLRDKVVLHRLILARHVRANVHRPALGAADKHHAASAAQPDGRHSGRGERGRGAPLRLLLEVLVPVDCLVALLDRARRRIRPQHCAIASGRVSAAALARHGVRSAVREWTDRAGARGTRSGPASATPGTRPTADRCPRLQQGDASATTLYPAPALGWRRVARSAPPHPAALRGPNPRAQPPQSLPTPERQSPAGSRGCFRALRGARRRARGGAPLAPFLPLPFPFFFPCEQNGAAQHRLSAARLSVAVAAGAPSPCPSSPSSLEVGAEKRRCSAARGSSPRPRPLRPPPRRRRALRAPRNGRQRPCGRYVRDAATGVGAGVSQQLAAHRDRSAR